MKSPGITTLGPEGEPYPDFQKRVAAEGLLVKQKCAALDQFIPCCTACGETCDPIDAGTRCKSNGMLMVSRWAREKAKVEFFGLGHFGGSWSTEVTNLAALLDRVRAGEV